MIITYKMNMYDDKVTTVFNREGKQYIVNNIIAKDGELYYEMADFEGLQPATKFILYPTMQYIGIDTNLEKGKTYVVISELVYDDITYYTLKGIEGRYNSADFVFISESSFNEDSSLVITEEEIEFRTKLLNLYQDVYNSSSNFDTGVDFPIKIAYLSMDNLIHYIVNCNEKEDILEKLIECGDIDIMDIFFTYATISKYEEDNGPWFFAAIYNCKYALEKLKDLKIEAPKNLLIRYCSNTDSIELDTIKFLVGELEIDVNETFRGETALDTLSRKHELEAIKYLLQKGANVNPNDEDLNAIESCIHGYDRLSSEEITEERKKRVNEVFNLLYRNGCPLVIQERGMRKVTFTNNE